MPVNYDNSQFQQTQSAAAAVNITVTTGACLIVAVATKGNEDRSVSAVYAGGVAMTRLARIAADATNPTNPVQLEVYGRTAAPSGIVTVSAQLVGVAGSVTLYAGSYTGCRATDPFHVVDSGSLSGVTNVVITCSTSTTDRVVWFNACHFITSAMNATQRHVSTSYFGSFMADTAGPASTVNLSATSSAQAGISSNAFIGINLIFSASASSITSWRGLVGVGR